MKRPFILFLLFLPLFATAQVEYRKYAIKVIGIKVGELIATKSKTSDLGYKYTLSSQVDVNFLVYHLLVDYRVASQFNGEAMSSSEVIVKSNRGDFNTKTIKVAHGYKLTSVQPKKEIEKTVKSSIKDTFSSIHFHEPVGKSRAYAEFYGDFIKITPLGNHTYTGVLDDNKDEYYYENGLLVKAVKKNPITDMVIVFEKSWVE